jgi:hypothetical protein
MRETDYRLALDHDAEIVVRFSTDKQGVTSYRVVLLAVIDGEQHAVRVFDNAHGVHDMHRYEGQTKLPAETFSTATAGEAMRDAIGQVLGSYREMIEVWKPRPA